jgi:uncharacterized membrane protein YbhN (UPF0104 family)
MSKLPPREVIGRLRWLRLGIGLVILVGLIVYLTPRALLAQLKAVEAAWLLAAAVAIVVATLVGSYALYLLISRDRSLHYRRFLRAYWTAWSVGLVVPGQIGDLAMLTVLMQRRGLHWPISLGRSVLDKLISLAVLCSFAAWGLITSLPAVSVTPTQIIVGAAVVGLVGLATWLVVRLAGGGQQIGNRPLDAVRSTAMEIANSVLEHPGRTTLNLALTVLKFGFIVLAYWCAFRALGQDQLEYLRALPLVAVSALVAYIPISFNGLGTVEFAGIWLFGAVGIAQTTVLSAYLLLRVMVLTLAWLPLSVALLTGRRLAAQPLSEN